MATVVIRIKVDDDASKKIAKVAAELKALKAAAGDLGNVSDRASRRMDALGDSTDRVSASNKKASKTFSGLSDDLDEVAKSSERVDRNFRGTGKSLNALEKQAKRTEKAGKFLIKMFKFLAIETLAMVAVLGSFKLALLAVDLIGRGVHATMTGIGAAVGAAVAALSTFLAARRELQVAQLSPLFGNQNTGIGGTTQRVGGIAQSRTFAPFSEASLLQSINDLANVGITADDQLQRLLRTLGDFATAGVGDPSKKLQQLVGIFAQLNTETTVSSTTFTALKNQAPELARAFGEFVGGTGDYGALIKAGEKAAEGGKVSSQAFIDAVMGGNLQSIAAYRGQLDRVNDTLINRFKATTRTIQGLLTDMGAPLLDSLKTPLVQVERSLVSFVSVIKPTLQRVFPAFGTDVAGIFDTMADKLALLVVRGVPKLESLRDSAVGLARDIRDWWGDKVYPVLERMAAGWDALWDSFIGPIVKGAWDLIKFAVADYVRLAEEAGDRTSDMGVAIQSAFHFAKNMVKAFNDMRVALAPVVTAVLTFVGAFGELTDKFPGIAKALAGLGVMFTMRKIGAFGGGKVSSLLGRRGAEQAADIGLRSVAQSATVAASSLSRLSAAAAGLSVARSRVIGGGVDTGMVYGPAAPRGTRARNFASRHAGTLANAGALAALVGGSYLQSSGNQTAAGIGEVLQYGGTGAMIGASVGGPVGALVGAGLGMAGGTALSLWNSRHAQEEADRRAKEGIVEFTQERNWGGVDPNRMQSILAGQKRVFEEDIKMRELYNQQVAEYNSIGDDKRRKELAKSLRTLGVQIEQNEKDFTRMGDAAKVLDANMQLAETTLGITGDEIAAWAERAGVNISETILTSDMLFEGILGWTKDISQNVAIASQRFSDLFMGPIEAAQRNEEIAAGLQSSAEALSRLGPGATNAEMTAAIDEYLTHVNALWAEKIAEGMPVMQAMQGAIGQLETFADAWNLSPEVRAAFEQRIAPTMTELQTTLHDPAKLARIDPTTAKAQVADLAKADLEITGINLDGVTGAEVQQAINVWASKAGLKIPVSGFDIPTGPDKPPGDTRTSRLGRVLGVHNRLSAQLGGRQFITSGIRGFGLGSLGSDHLSGAAIDVQGDNLVSYAAGIRAGGGVAEFHGNGADRHLHVVPGGIGDSATPAVGGVGGGGVAVMVTQQNTIVIQDSPNPEATAAAVKRQLEREAREAAERA